MEKVSPPEQSRNTVILISLIFLALAILISHYALERKSRGIDPPKQEKVYKDTIIGNTRYIVR